jgi:hypothetical protein
MTSGESGRNLQNEGFSCARCGKSFSYTQYQEDLGMARSISENIPTVVVVAEGVTEAARLQRNDPLLILQLAGAGATSDARSPANGYDISAIGQMPKQKSQRFFIA